MSKTITFTVRQIVVTLLGTFFIGLSFFGGFHFLQAATQSIKLIGDKDFQFHLVDLTNETQQEVYVFLPPTQGHDGEIHIVKAFSASGTSSHVVVNTNAADSLNGVKRNNGLNGGDGLGVFDSMVITLIADAANNTWWVVEYAPHAE